VLLAPGSPDALRIDAALTDWRQGDLAVEEHWFTQVADATNALTPESAEAGDGLQAVTVDVEGLAVATQSCDIVRSSTERPFIEVSPVVKVSASVIQEIARGRRPAYAIIPAVRKRSLVAHLDRVMTVEKAVVASWKRTPGCGTDHERRDFARALVRKRARVAFPDDFVEIAEKLLGRLQSKHDKDSDEGRALRALREIRARAAPSWNADQGEVAFWYIPESDELDFRGARLERVPRSLAQPDHPGWAVHEDRGRRMYPRRPHHPRLRGDRPARPRPPFVPRGVTRPSPLRILP